ncbi:class E basic helix-loop-helix protein 40 [Neosynchiropus ocellatus]
MERITTAQPPPPPCAPNHASLDDMQGLDFSMYVYKQRRGMKRGEESKETYKLPHRLIEKKRRDRINECIAQLKDLLPEHLKLTTLGHLEKAVVLELTLKHVKALSALLDQQQQKIQALQKDLQISADHGDDGENAEEMFRSGFHLCAKEVVHYLASQDGSGDVTPSHVISHIQKVSAEVMQPHMVESVHSGAETVKKPGGQTPRAVEGTAKNCVPVIQRLSPHRTGEQSGSDTDTDSGYGGEHDKPKAQWLESHIKEGQLKHSVAKRMAEAVKHEGDEPQAKKLRCDSPEEEDDDDSRHPVDAPNGYMGFSSNQPPFCLPFYLIPPAAAAAAAYLPLLEKCWYPGGMPVMYPGMGSGTSLPSETLPSSLMSPRPGSPAPHHSLDSPAHRDVLKQVPPLDLETKD